MGDPEDVYMVVEMDENEFGEVIVIKKEVEEDEFEEIAEDQFTYVVDNSSLQTIVEDSTDGNVEIVYLSEYINGDDASEFTLLEGEMIDGNIICTPNVKPNIQTQIVSAGSNKKSKSLKLKENNSLNKSVKISQLAGKSNIDRTNLNKVKKREKVWQHTDFIPDAISSVTTIQTGRVKAKTISKPAAVVDKTQTITVVDTSRPYKCEYCKQSFRQSTSLQLHLSSMHKVAPESCLVS